ncbi:MAG TPA: hypothetical protein VL461_13995, partial [Dictyobacter sp.]|nr:hypothetical protein [Dictyobacter sp.]
MVIGIRMPLGVERSVPRRKHIRRRKHVCMLVLVPGQTNYRVMNDATALVAAGYHVTIVDVVAQRTHSQIERYRGIDFRHVVSPSWFTQTHGKLWFLVKMLFVWVRCFWQMVGINADVYHAHVEHTFLVAYLIARLRRKHLIFDTPELTMFGPAILRWPRTRTLAIAVIRMMSRYCDVHITGSPLYVPILIELYDNKRMCIIRHIPLYHRASKSNLLHQKLGLPLSTRIALYQGYLQPDRGLTLLAQVAGYLPSDIVIVM